MLLFFSHILYIVLFDLFCWIVSCFLLCYFVAATYGIGCHCPKYSRSSVRLHVIKIPQKVICTLCSNSCKGYNGWPIRKSFQLIEFSSVQQKLATSTLQQKKTLPQFYKSLDWILALKLCAFMNAWAMTYLLQYKDEQHSVSKYTTSTTIGPSRWTSLKKD